MTIIKALGMNKIVGATRMAFRWGMLNFAAGIISGTEFLKTDFSGQIHLGQIPIN